MKKMINKSHIEGILYEHDLKKKVTGPNSKSPNTPYISGSISIATDDAMTNIVTVHYTYVTEKTNKNEVNKNYSILSNIADGILKTYMSPDSNENNVAKLAVNSAIGLLEFYAERNGNEEELVSVKRNEGGFITVLKSLNPAQGERNTFEADMLITKVRHVDANPDTDSPEKAIIGGAIFNFRNELLPVEFTAVDPNAIGYFEGLEASQSNPVFTQVKGNQVSETIVKKYVQESAFSDDIVREVKSSKKDFVINWAAKETYVWDDEGTILASELVDCVKNREVYLATLKQRRDEYKASKANASNAIPTNNTNTSTTFKF